MNAVKKTVNKWLGLVLAIAMVFSLNLTSITANAAVEKPTATSEVTKPTGVTGVTIGGKAAKFYKDDNGDQVYIRYTYPANTTIDTFKKVEVAITAPTATVTSNDVTINKTGFIYKFTANLMNNAPVVTIGGTDYIVAAGATDSTWNLTTSAETGYVSAATLSGTVASVTKNLYGDKYPGNVYYAQQKSTWITVNNRIDAKDVTATDISNVALNYTIDGSAKTTQVNLKPGSVKVTLGSQEYTVTASVKGAFKATAESFQIDFKEMRNSTTAGQIPDQTAKDQATEIENALKDYYAAEDTQKIFPEGTTNMTVLQTILQWASDNGKFTKGDTTLGSNVTYVAEIDGLGEFSVGSMSGWMYTDDPSNTDYTKWPTPAVGGADYVLSPDSTIVWFFTVNYGSHPW